VRNRIDPKRASIDITTIKVKSNSCKKGTDWYRYFVYPDRNGGLLCNGERDWRMTHKRWGPPYFNGPMRQILDYILVEDDLDTLGPGRVKRIESNGNVATVTYKVFKYGKYTGLDKELRIVGSTVSVGEPS
jgi:hypothetical protein